MNTPACAGCERPAHAGPCYPEIVGPLNARIAALEAAVAALQSAAQPASAPGDVRGRYTLREPVRAIQYDGRYRGARYFAIERMLHEAFGADPDDRRAALTTDPTTRENPVAVHTSADGSPGYVVPIRADDYVVVYYVDGEAAAVTVLAEQAFDAAYVAVG